MAGHFSVAAAAVPMLYVCFFLVISCPLCTESMYGIVKYRCSVSNTHTFCFQLNIFFPRFALLIENDAGLMLNAAHNSPRRIQTISLENNIYAFYFQVYFRFNSWCCWESTSTIVVCSYIIFFLQNHSNWRPKFT